jgi:hypothetical protein
MGYAPLPAPALCWCWQPYCLLWEEPRLKPEYQFNDEVRRLWQCQYTDWIGQ